MLDNRSKTRLCDDADTTCSWCSVFFCICKFCSIGRLWLGERRKSRMAAAATTHTINKGRSRSEGSYENRRVGNRPPHGLQILQGLFRRRARLYIVLIIVFQQQ